MIRTSIVTVSYGNRPPVLPNPSKGARSLSLSSGKPSQIAPRTWMREGQKRATGHLKLFSHQEQMRSASAVRRFPRGAREGFSTLHQTSSRKRPMRVGERDRLRFRGGRPGFGGNFPSAPQAAQ